MVLSGGSRLSHGAAPLLHPVDPLQEDGMVLLMFTYII